MSSHQDRYKYEQSRENYMARQRAYKRARRRLAAKYRGEQNDILAGLNDDLTVSKAAMIQRAVGVLTERHSEEYHLLIKAEHANEPTYVPIYDKSGAA